MRSRLKDRAKSEADPVGGPATQNKEISMKAVTANSAATLPNDTELQVSGAWNSENNDVIVRSYHELADHPVVETDLLSEFNTNLKLLSELQGRMSFVMKEVRYVLKLSL